MRHNRLMMAITIIVSICLGVSAATLSYSQVLLVADEAVTNILYQYNPFEQADSSITLITIDETSEEIYGDYSTWSRSILAEVVDTVSEDGATVIGLDTDLSQPGTDTEGDSALVDACQKAQNVVALASARFDTKDPQPALSPDGTPSGTPSDTNSPQEPTPTMDRDVSDNLFRPDAADDSMSWTEHQVTELTLPFDDLAEVVTLGVSNATQQSPDGFIRQAALFLRYGNLQYDSFAVAMYKQHQSVLGLPYRLPELDSQELFSFNTIWNTKSYQTISVCDLLSGNYDKNLLSDHMVLIGEYQDPSQENLITNLTMRRDTQDILLQASMLQSLLNQRTVENTHPLLQAILFGILIGAFYLCFANRKIWFMFVSFVAYAASFFLCATVANSRGHRILLLIPLVYAVLSMILMLLQHLLFSTLERIKMEKTFKLYVDSSVVDEVTEADPLTLAKLSQRREIAVLFVDVRGFTTISERLDPEQVVEILNAYFTVVAGAISRWGGTLDKFIGDAAMAIFNAPKPLPDYCFYAACAADDIMREFNTIKTSYEEKYNLSLNIGIGINAGEAIVGNIGCRSHMDYTAIGDAVNTASRLESKAGPGQILISESMRDAIAVHSQTSFVGDLRLKGKTCEVKTYEINSIAKPKHALKERKELLLPNAAALNESRERVEELLDENKEWVEGLLVENREKVEEILVENRERIEELLKDRKQSREGH